jgi:hypothetical protein
MPGRLVQLQADVGINRLKVKGGPPKGALYDLLNGYVDATGCPVSRPGSVEDYTLPAGTVGMCAFDGALVVFSHAPVSGMPAGVSCEVLTHPDDPTLALVDIHFAGPFLGYLYVCAEFADGGVYDYWLQRRGAWEASTMYQLGDIVEPTTRNGYGYRATRSTDPAPLWVANAPRTVGDRVEPTTADGYVYEVVDTLGTNPRSGATEPAWNDEDGALTYEDVDTGAVTAPATGPVTPPTTPGGDVTDRYRNPGGSVDYRSTQ